MNMWVGMCIWLSKQQDKLSLRVALKSCMLLSVMPGPKQLSYSCMSSLTHLCTWGGVWHIQPHAEDTHKTDMVVLIVNILGLVHLRTTLCVKDCLLDQSTDLIVAQRSTPQPVSVP
jgi:hypothetical protein